MARADGRRRRDRELGLQELTMATEGAATESVVAAGPSAGRVLSTLNADGSRRWLRPRLSKGRFLARRRLVAYALIALFTALPFVRIGGHPAILIDVVRREFHFFGRTLLPTDSLVFALLMVCIFLGIFLVTALAGRIWCGWACPQTVYMEFLYRPIERFFDGAPGRAARVGPTGVRKAAKHAAFFLCTVYLSHTFLAYFVGIETLYHWVGQSPLEHPTAFLVMAGTFALMTFDFGYFREQTCLVACPYGRLQSALLDRNSLIVGYDRARGEPRGVKRRGRGAEAVVSLDVLPEAAPRAGDCVDCRMCVTTCPTGIDIRDGLQMECIGCAQCIDACDAVMDKIGRPRGLVRYSSQARVAGERARILRPRVVIYPVILLGALALMVVTLQRAGVAEAALLPRTGKPFYELPTGEISNQFRVRLVNRAGAPAVFTLSMHGDAARLIVEENPLVLKPGESRTTPITLAIARDAFTHAAVDVTLRVSTDSGFMKDLSFHALGPAGQAPASTGHGDRP